MELNVLNIAGKETGKKVSLKDSIFKVEPNDHAIYLDVKQYLANNRQGTHKSKERGEITASTRKIKRQKGTGTARAGSLKSPVFRGGGRVFGPRPRDYHFKLNKKLKQVARLSALSYKATENAITIVEDFKLEQPKTKEYLNVLNNLQVADKKSLLVVSEADNNIYLSSRNLKKCKVITVDNLNTYDIVDSANLIFVESSLETLQKDA